MRSYFTGVIGYVFLVLFLAIGGAIFCFTTLFSMSADITSFFTYMMIVSAVMLPLLTMKSFSDERKTKTEQLLLTAPVSLTGMVFAKFLAALTMFAGSLIINSLYFLILYPYASVKTANLLGNVLALLLVGMTFIAIGIFVSALTENQLSAAVSTIGVIIFMVIVGLVNQIGTDEEGTRLISNYAVRFVIDWISVLSRFSNFGYGMLDFSALVYYLSLSGIFIFLTIRVYEKRRWG